MPYVPRPATTIKCAHCKTAFESHHASRKYCSNSCNVLASYERTGYRGEPRASRADLERMLAKVMEMTELMQLQTKLSPSKPATPKPAAKAAAKPAVKKPAAKAAPATPKPTAKAAVKTPSKTAKPAEPTPKATAKPAPKPAKKAAKQRVKAKPTNRVINL